MKKEKLAYERGYRIDKDGKIYGLRKKEIKVNKIYRGRNNKNPYYSFSILCKPLHYHIFVHRFQAFMKYGEEIYKDGIVVRHLNGNSLDNSWDNIAIGTQSDNMYDISQEERMKFYKSKMFEDNIYKNILCDKEHGLTYKEIAKKYHISNKGTIWNICNKRKLYKIKKIL